MRCSTPTVSPEDRTRLLEIAPPEPGDHVVSLYRPGGVGIGPPKSIYAIVRRDALGARIVAVGRSADEVLKKSRPLTAAERAQRLKTAAEGQLWGNRESMQRGQRRGGRRGSAVTTERRRAAEAEFRGELAEYRRAVEGVGVEGASLDLP